MGLWEWPQGSLLGPIRVSSDHCSPVSLTCASNLSRTFPAKPGRGGSEPASPSSASAHLDSWLDLGLAKARLNAHTLILKDELLINFHKACHGTIWLAFVTTALHKRKDIFKEFGYI